MIQGILIAIGILVYLFLLGLVAQLIENFLGIDRYPGGCGCIVWCFGILIPLAGFLGYMFTGRIW